MAIIDSAGLFLGDRLGCCSDVAQLHWPRLYSAANNYARLELNYRKIISKAYANFRTPPSEKEFWAMIREYKDNFLLFVYETGDGVLWGQWQTNERYLLGHKNAEDRRSPAPPIDAQDAYRKAYLDKKKDNSHKNVELADLLEVVQSCSELCDLPGVTVAGVGVGEGVGEGKKQKPSRPPKGERVPDPRHQEFKLAFRAYYLHKNPALKEIPWDAQEANQLSRFLRKNPAFTTEQWKSLLNHRARSPVPHAEQLSAWISRALNWSAGATDAYGKQITRGSGNAKPTFDENIAAKQRALDSFNAKCLADEQDRGSRTLEARSASIEPGSTGDTSFALR